MEKSCIIFYNLTHAIKIFLRDSVHSFKNGLLVNNDCMRVTELITN